jgi:hypothetical protein
MLVVPDNIKEERLQICNTCEFFTTLSRCKKCGCFMPAKILIKRAKCPINKWMPYEEKNNDGQ